MSRVASDGRYSDDVTYPSDISGLELWLRADSIRHLSDGGSVDYWTDQSQNGNSCSEATNQPTWQDDELNGYPVVRFDGTNDHLSGTSPQTPILAHTFVVFKYNDGASWDSYDGIVTGQIANATDTRIIGDGGTTSSIYVADMNPAGGGFVHVDGATSHDPDLGDLTQWHILSVHDNTSAALASNYRIGHDRANAARFCACDIAEVIGYSAELSVANELLVVTYLNNKYRVY